MRADPPSRDMPTSRKPHAFGKHTFGTWQPLKARLMQRQTEGSRGRPQPRGPAPLPVRRLSRFPPRPTQPPARRPHSAPHTHPGAQGSSPRGPLPANRAAAAEAGCRRPVPPPAAHLLLPPAQPLAPLTAPLQLPDDVLALAQRLALLGAPLRRRLPPDAGHLPGTDGRSRRPAATGRGGPGCAVPYLSPPVPLLLLPQDLGARRRLPLRAAQAAAGRHRPGSAPLPLPAAPPRRRFRYPARAAASHFRRRRPVCDSAPPAPRRTAPQGSARRGCLKAVYCHVQNSGGRGRTLCTAINNARPPAAPAIT